MTDRYAVVYLFVDHTRRRLCLARVLRDFTALGERDRAPGRLGRKLQRTLREVFKIINQPGDANVARAQQAPSFARNAGTPGLR